MALSRWCAKEAGAPPERCCRRRTVTMSTHGATGRFQREELVGKYLTFALGNEEYSVPVLKVREIIKIMDITAVPQVPHYVKGVVNLRGKVIPVVDLRLKFGFPPQEYSERTCIIVVEVVLSAGRPVMMGIIVDHVSEVLNVTAEEIEQTPEF